MSILTSIAETIVSLIRFIIHGIQSFLTLILSIPRYLTYLSNAVLSVPNVFIPFLTASISIYVIFLLIRKDY